MRPVSIALGGVFALVLTGATLAAPSNSPQGGHPLNPQPLPPGSQAQDRPAQTAYVLTVCASRKAAGGAKGHAAAAPQGAAGTGKASAACASGRH